MKRPAASTRNTLLAWAGTVVMLDIVSRVPTYRKYRFLDIHGSITSNAFCRFTRYHLRMFYADTQGKASIYRSRIDFAFLFIGLSDRNRLAALSYRIEIDYRSSELYRTRIPFIVQPYRIEFDSRIYYYIHRCIAGTFRRQRLKPHSRSGYVNILGKSAKTPREAANEPREERTKIK